MDNYKKKSIAIIGGGLAGISTAYQLSLKGYKDITIFETKDKLSGLVLTHKTIDNIEIERLKDLFGIESNIIQGANGILNGKVLRFKNEPVRHKTLDLIGDLALLGFPIKGHVTAARAGHASNVEFVKKLKKHYSKELKALRKA